MGVPINPNTVSTGGDTAVYKLSSDSGKINKLYHVPEGNTAEFEQKIEKKKESLAQSTGEDIHVVKLQKLF